MSTGSTGNGLSDATAFTVRVKDWTAGVEIESANLNAIQDNAIALNTAISATRAATLPHRTCTYNQSDSPAPNLSGGCVVEVEVPTNGTTVVVVDSSIDWRDRYIMVWGGLLPAALFAQQRPGGALDDTFDGSMTATDTLNSVFYSEQGHNGTASNPGLELTPATFTDKWRLFARSSDGALCVVKNGTVDGEIGMVGRVWAGPQQNHY
ncbi:hypothetical protein L6R49_10460 [Myxococcota bacterium]|nr:hypothetical protein [Myxococcota bacterium]